MAADRVQFDSCDPQSVDSVHIMLVIALLGSSQFEFVSERRLLLERPIRPSAMELEDRSAPKQRS